MAQLAFPAQTFTLPSGSPLAEGYLLVSLNLDAHSPGGLVLGHVDTKVALDSSGTISGSFLVWSNADLTPLGTYYVLRAYSEAGQLVLGPLQITVGAVSGEGFGTAFGSYFGS